MKMPAHQTKIICTIGPSTQTAEMIKQLIKGGMNIARLNMAHGTLDWHRNIITLIRRIATESRKEIAIMADLPGPKLRIGTLDSPYLQIKKGDILLLGDNKKPQTTTTPHTHHIPVEAPVLFEILHSGDKIYLNDGLIQIRIMKNDNRELVAKALNTGILLSKKGINLPGIDVGTAFTPADQKFLEFAIKYNVDAIGLSFIQTAQDIQVCRNQVKALGANPTLIAKIERRQAISNIDSIIEASDGIMIARGDLGVETPIASIAILQKKIIHKCNQQSKPVITATQMLESMVNDRRPTRAEVTDVANAIIDGTDAVMLSEESAIGVFPSESIKMLTKIARSAEKQSPMLSNKADDLKLRNKLESIIAYHTAAIAKQIHAQFIIAPTKTGATPRHIAKQRPSTWIIALTHNPETAKALVFSRGVHAVYIPNTGDWKSFIPLWLKQNVKSYGLAIVVKGPSKGNPTEHNGLEVIELS